MDTYEITYLVESQEKSKAVKELIQSAGATYKEVKDWGERDLAYPILGFSKAFYFTGTIKTIATNITESRRN